MFRFRWVSRPTIGCYWVSASATLSTTPLFVSVRNQYPTEPLLPSSSVALFSRKRSCGPFLWLGLSLAAGLLPGLQTDGLPIEGVFVCSGWAAPRSFEQRSEPCAPPPHHRPAHCRESLRPAHPRSFGARPGPGGVCSRGGWAARRPVFFRLGRSRDGWSVFHRRLAERVRRKSSVGPQGDRRPRKMRRQTSAAASKRDRKVFETLQLLWNVTPAPHLTWIQRAAAQECHLIFFNFNLHEARNKQKSHSRESYGIKIFQKRFSFCIASKII